MALSQQPLGLLLVLINIHEGLSTVPNIYSVLSCSHFYPTSETSQNALHTQFSLTMDHTTALWSRSHFIPIFTDEETEAHGSRVTQHLRAWVQPGLPNFKAPALNLLIAPSLKDLLIEKVACVFLLPFWGFLRETSTIWGWLQVARVM